MIKRITVFFIPILILLLMSLPPLLTLSRGEEITLETMPIDPNDLFRGEYISLRYEISQADEEVLSKELIDHFLINDHGLRVYVSLQKNKDGYFDLKHVSIDKPKEGIYLKGILHQYRQYQEYTFDGSIENEKEFYKNHIPTFKYVYEINYNLDKFFVPESSGVEFEKAAEKGNLLAKVKVSNGNAILTDVEIK